MQSIPETLQLRSRRWAKSVAVGLFAAIAGFYLVLPLLIARAAGDIWHAPWSYNGAAIALSYFDTGFARRELEGTLIRLFATDPMVGGLVFHLVTCSAFLGLAVMATLKAALPDRNRLAIGAVFLAVFANVAVDVGRADPAIMICGLAAAWSARRGRWIMAAAALSVALAFHEAGFIVLAPMVACIAWESGSWRAGGAVSRVSGLLLVGAGLASYAAAFGAYPDVQALGRKIHAEFADPRMADLSVYYTLSGPRGLASILCQQRLDGFYLSTIVKGAGLIGLLSFALRPSRWLAMSAVALAPFLFLSAVAVDVGRWATLAAFGIAAMAVTEGRRTGGSEVPPLRPGNVLLAVAAAVLMMLRPHLIDLGDPLPIIPNFQYGQGRPPFSALDAATQCDPGWRRFIGVAS